MKALLDIAMIEAAHRNAERSYDRMQVGTLDVPRQWAHLTLLERIGEGEFGEVYRAHDSKLQIDVALKLSADVVGQALDASKVLDEARLLAKVRHPNVVRIYGADQKQGRVGLWMDLGAGPNARRAREDAGFRGRRGDQHRHRAVSRAGRGAFGGRAPRRHQGAQRHPPATATIVLVDFGAGRHLSTEPRKGSDVVGTPVYMAPEVLNDQPRSAASDIYSLGVLLFHLITNDYPCTQQPGRLYRGAKSGARKRLRDFGPTCRTASSRSSSEPRRQTPMHGLHRPERSRQP